MTQRDIGGAIKKAILNEKVPLPETNIAPENGWLEDEFLFGMAQPGRCNISSQVGFWNTRILI